MLVPTLSPSSQARLDQAPTLRFGNPYGCVVDRAQGYIMGPDAGLAFMHWRDRIYEENFYAYTFHLSQFGNLDGIEYTMPLALCTTWTASQRNPGRNTKEKDPGHVPDYLTWASRGTKVAPEQHMVAPDPEP